MTDYEYTKDIALTASKFVTTNYYVTDDGDLRCECRLFAMLVAKLMHGDTGLYEKDQFVNYKYVVYIDALPF